MMTFMAIGMPSRIVRQTNRQTHSLERLLPVTHHTKVSGLQYFHATTILEKLHLTIFSIALYQAFNFLYIEKAKFGGNN